MKFYPSGKSLPSELELPNAQHMGLWNECMTLIKLPGAAFWLGFLPVWVGVLSLITFLGPRIMHPFHVTWLLVEGTWGGILGVVMQNMVFHKRLQKFRELTGGLCLRCGYDIRLESCPKCGCKITR
jgi:hypothetical protein